MRRTLLYSFLAAAGLFTAVGVSLPTLHAAQLPTAPVYAIKGAKIVTVSGATIDKGNVVMRNGIITDVGPNAAIPDDAVVIDGAGLTAYPGLIDMGNAAATRPATVANAGNAGAGRGGGGGRGGGNADPSATWADGDRAKRAALLRADYSAAETTHVDGADMTRYAAAGITSMLALPTDGLIRGESALINTLAPEDPMEVSAVASDRRGSVVVKSPVALTVSFTGRAGGAGYPEALLGSIAFVRQSFYDAQWQKDARVFAATHVDQTRPNYEPVLDAMVPALERKMPVMFDGGEFREILRALAMAKEFNLDPIIIGGLESAEAAGDLKAANAKVVLTMTTGGGGGRGAGGGRGGGGDTAIRVTRMQQNAWKNAAALEAAGVPYAFSSEGLADAAQFVANVSRAVREGGLLPDQALRALTINAAKMAGVADRLGSIDKGKIANVLLTDGDLLSGGKVRHVFIGGRAIDVR